MSHERAEPCVSASVSSGLALSIAIVLVTSFTPSYRHDLLAASYSLSPSPLAPSLTSYSSLCIVQLPGVSVTLRAALTMSQSSQSYSPRPSCYRPRHRRRAHRHPPHSCRAHRDVLIASCSSRCAHRLVLIASCSSRRAHRVVLIASCSSRRAHRVVLIASCSSRSAHRVVLIASCSSRRAHRVVLIASCSSRRAHRVVLIASCSSRRAHRVVLIASCSSRRAHRVVLIASCSLRPAQRVVLITSCSPRPAQRFVSYLPTFLCFRAKCGSSIYRCTLDRMNRTGLSHNAWNPLRVCECDKSICYDVPCLDRQRDRGAMTRVVWTPFALKLLRPEGKCSDMPASRRKMP